MTRMFERHQIRNTVSLDGTWELYFPATGTVIEPHAWKKGVCEKMEVPSVWEMLNARKTYRGQAVARIIISLPDDTRIRLVFEGVSHTARVFLDGRELGGHHNAFTAFTLDAGNVRAGEHELLVHISNEHGELSALHIPNDYYNYGGISRPVEIQFVANDVVIDHVHAQTMPEGEEWMAVCRAQVVNFSTVPRTLILKATLAGKGCEQKITAAPGSSIHEWDMSCPGVQSWSPENPALYLLETVLLDNGRPLDDLTERIGFRTIIVDGDKILLNGEKVFPMGFNRHEDHALYGCAIPVNVMRADLEAMREMNANAVRTSHYPNDPRFLDLCDEMGFLVWEENHARGLNQEKMLHPRFREQCAACNAEMVAQHFNHPAIFVWGILNECASETDTGAALYREQFEQIRAMDPSRPVTFASCRHAEDRCQGLVDIAGWNIYPLWYHNTPVLETLHDLITRREREGMKNKPLIISEFGAGAIPGFRDPVRRPKWSEERQCDILDAQLDAILNHPRVTGAFIWQFCDVRVDEAVAMNRPRTMNNKGAVDEIRRPKLVVEVIRRRFAEKQALLAASARAVPATQPEVAFSHETRTLLEPPPPYHQTIGQTITENQRRKTLNTAVLGLGRIAWQLHIPEIKRHAGFQLAAVVDPLAERRAEAIAAHGCEAYADLDGLLQARRDLDLVVVASPTPFHAAQTLTAFAHGLDVLCDKPMAMNLEESDRMIAGMKACGRKLMVYQPHRANAEVQTLRDLLSRDLIGRVYLIKRALSQYTRRNDWQAFTKNGGGMLNNYGAHMIDQLLYLTQSKAARVSCLLKTIASLGDADDVVKAVIETENDVILDIDINMAAALPIQEWFVAGERGSLTYDRAQKAWIARFFAPGALPELHTQAGLAAAERRYGSGESIPWQDAAFPVAATAAIDFYEACYAFYARGETPFVPIKSTREVMRVMAACRKRASSPAD
jgi:beta-glucuronidase